MTEEQPQPEVPPRSKRLPFDQELQERTKAFIASTLEEVPEVEALAVTFSYGQLNTQLPYAIVMGQSGPLRTPTEIVHMSQQLLRTLNFQVQLGAQYVQHIDELMAGKAKELQALQEQIDNAKRQLTGIEVERDRRVPQTPPGTPGEGSPEPGTDTPG